MDHWVRSFRKNRRVMPEIELHNHDTNGEPVVTFATDAEIAIADQLRHRLEERFLARSVPLGEA